jgi:uncharacterized protein (DUF924 family)
MDTKILGDIYRYWFGELKSPADFSRERVQMWMRQSDATDREVRESYGRFIPEAAKADWEIESLSRQEGVALVVLLDQFPRNIFRSSGEAFAYDPIARDFTRRLIARGFACFFYVERFLLSLPFQHHEDMADQDYAVMLAAGTAVNGPDSMRDFHRGVLDFAIKHRELIRRFGRYPHRNAMLGRPSTLEEEAFLKEHGRGF